MDIEVIWEVAIRDIPGLLLFCDSVITQYRTDTEKPGAEEANVE
jgi:hypothetical protein